MIILILFARSSVYNTIRSSKKNTEYCTKKFCVIYCLLIDGGDTTLITVSTRRTNEALYETILYVVIDRIR